MTEKKKIKSYLSDQEHQAIERFVADSVMLEAVKKVLMESVYSQGVLKDGQPCDPSMNYAFALASRKKTQGFTSLTNEQIGADLCAVWEGTNLVGCGFAELEKFKKIDEPKKIGSNPAR